MHDHSQMNHGDETHVHPESTPIEYLKFVGVILAIFGIAYFINSNFGTETVSSYLRMFMGTFFLVFGTFKLLDLKGFAMSYIGYDVIAKRFMSYAYAYPFIELALAFGYFFQVPYTDWVTLVFMAVGSIGVLQELLRGSKIKCACLGTYIRLPLTTVSLIENVAMGIMALFMIIKII